MWRAPEDSRSNGYPDQGWTIRTSAVIELRPRPRYSAVAFERSNSRPSMNGPRSLTITTAWRSPKVMSSRVPCASVLWAIVKSRSSKIAPLEARRPWKPGPYHEATPRNTFPVDVNPGGIPIVGPSGNEARRFACSTVSLSRIPVAPVVSSMSWERRSR